MLCFKCNAHAYTSLIQVFHLERFQIKTTVALGEEQSGSNSGSSISAGLKGDLL